MLNRDIVKWNDGNWTDEAIRNRTQKLVEIITKIWAVPPNHRSGFSPEKTGHHKKVDLSDLIAAGVLEPGMSLFPRRKKYSHKVAVLLPDGQVEVDGVAFSSPFNAASSIVGKRTNGWGFFLTDQTSKRSLRDVRRDYLNSIAGDAEDDEPDDDGGDDEEGDGT